MSDKEYIETARATHDQDGHGRDFESCQYGVCKAANLLAERDALQRRADAAEGLVKALETEQKFWIAAQAQSKFETVAYRNAQLRLMKLDAALAAFKQAGGKGE